MKRKVFFATLSRDLNGLVKTTDQGLSDALRILEALAKGDLSQSIDADYQGAFLELKTYSNNTVTQIKAVMSEIETLLDSANQGDFKAAIDMSGKTGFFNNLSRNLNDLMQTTDNGLADVINVLSTLAKGDLSQSINADYQGSFKLLKENANNTVLQIKQVMSEISQLVEMANMGNFTCHIDMAGKTGFFSDLSTNLNALMETTNNGLEDILGILSALAEGNLANRIDKDYAGSFGQLKDDANTTAEKLSEVISKIQISSDSVLDSANEISRGNSDLSGRTEQQASALEQTASSMEEMRDSLRQSESNAQQVNTIASKAHSKATEGGDVVSNAVTAMSEINHASRKIADIIGVIDEIAFQTNLLALNAAVEAARAGEQGRGFAVVAGEVRNLAQRSATAAKEIKSLIRDSVQKVEDGAKLVNQSGDTLIEIVDAVQEVSDSIEKITVAAKEQTEAIEQVNTSIKQMDSMTQQNAALAEETSATGESMSSEANSMKLQMNFFSFAAKS